MRKTDLGVYGVGIALYFQFIKSMVWFFFIATVLSMPAYIFYYSGNQSGLKA